MLPPQVGANRQQEPDSRTYVVRACRAMLRPIVRLLLKSGIVHREFQNLSREVYVDVARSEFGLGGRATSISRTALLTGLARKEVRRISNLIEAGDENRTEQAGQDRISRMLSGWYQDPDYLTTDGQPRLLPVDGPAPSFASLRARYGGDVPASAILRELISCGTVERAENGMLRPVYRNYRPNPTDPEHVLRAGNVVLDLGNTVIRNLYRGETGAREFERRAVNTNMPPDKLAEFQDMLRSEGQAFLERVDAWLSEHEVPDGKDSIRLGLGMYVIRDSDDE